MNVEIIKQVKELAHEKSIFIVEDDKEVLEILSEMFSSFFSKIYKSSSVNEAVELYKSLESHTNVVVLTDINLGSESGIDLSLELKKIYPIQTIIAISAMQETEVFLKSIECGVDRFVLKPLEQDILFEAILFSLEKIDRELENQKNAKLLKESQEKTLQLLSDQNRFVKDAIHEINTPLAVIIANVDILRLDGVEHESLDVIEAASRLIQHSHKDLSYLMKNETAEDTRVGIDLVSFLQDRKKYFMNVANKNTLKLSMVVGQRKLPLVFISKLKLSRIVDNTLSNAIKYSDPKSTVQISVGMQGGRYFFDVTNHGPIIKDTEKIFERFYRESTFKGGYGVGLNIVSEICAEENIELKVISEEDTGTIFRYFFDNATLLQHS